VPVDQAQSLANGHQRGEDSARQMPFLRAIFEGPIAYPKWSIPHALVPSTSQPSPKSSIPNRDSKPSIRFLVESSTRSERLRRVLFKEQVDIFPAVFNRTRSFRQGLRHSIACRDGDRFRRGRCADDEADPSMGIFSIRFRVIKKYVGLFEVARIWAVFWPVALKALLSCAN
jgi:hypothetical protein